MSSEEKEEFELSDDSKEQNLSDSKEQNLSDSKEQNPKEQNPKESGEKEQNPKESGSKEQNLKEQEEISNTTLTPEFIKNRYRHENKIMGITTFSIKELVQAYSRCEKVAVMFLEEIFPYLNKEEIEQYQCHNFNFMMFLENLRKLQPAKLGKSDDVQGINWLPARRYWEHLLKLYFVPTLQKYRKLPEIYFDSGVLHVPSTRDYTFSPCTSKCKRCAGTRNFLSFVLNNIKNILNNVLDSDDVFHDWANKIRMNIAICLLKIGATKEFTKVANSIRKDENMFGTIDMFYLAPNSLIKHQVLMSMNDETLCCLKEAMNSEQINISHLDQNITEITSWIKEGKELLDMFVGVSEVCEKTLFVRCHEIMELDIFPKEFIFALDKRNNPVISYILKETEWPNAIDNKQDLKHITLMALECDRRNTITILKRLDKARGKGKGEKAKAKGEKWEISPEIMMEVMKHSEISEQWEMILKWIRWPKKNSFAKWTVSIFERDPVALDFIIDMEILEGWQEEQPFLMIEPYNDECKKILKASGVKFKKSEQNYKNNKNKKNRRN